MDQFDGAACVNIGFSDVGILGMHKHVGRKQRVDCVDFLCINSLLDRLTVKSCVGIFQVLRF